VENRDYRKGKSKQKGGDNGDHTRMSGRRDPEEDGDKYYNSLLPNRWKKKQLKGPSSANNRLTTRMWIRKAGEEGNQEKRGDA